MTDPARAVIGGFDCHADTHTVAALDSLGRLLGTAEFAANRPGCERARRWLAGFGSVVAVGVASTGAYGAALTRHLRNHGLRVTGHDAIHLGELDLLGAPDTDVMAATSPRPTLRHLRRHRLR